MRAMHHARHADNGVSKRMVSNCNVQPHKTNE